MIFVISAVLIDETQKVPAVMIELYRLSMKCATCFVLPEVIF